MNTSITPGPAVEGRKGEGKMEKDDLQRIMRGLVNDAELMVDGILSPERAKATSYFRGELFGNEEAGRSQIVLTEVRDTVRGFLPSLLRIFFGPERVVEFTGRSAQSIAFAEQATDYVQYVFAEDNKGFLQAQDILIDGLVRKLGVIKWWWEPEKRVAHSDTLPIDEANELLARPDVELTSYEENDEEKDEDKTVDIEYVVVMEGHPKTCPVPPEEFLFDRHARTIDDALFVAHRTKRRRGDLVAMGFDEDEIDEHAGPPDRLDMNVEAQERQTLQAPILNQESDAGEANEEFEYIEAYPRIDFDGDGYAELRKICMIGPDHYVIYNEPVDERPFAGFCPIPEPHLVIGQSIADLTMDLQLTKSSIGRSMLDSLALSIFPRMAFLQNFVSVEDLLSTEIGAPIRTTKENAVTPISHPFTGEAAMPILEWFDTVGENRTGRDKGTMGLDADSLQSSTEEGVTAVLAASQEAIELIARIFAEQLLKPLFRGLYRMLVKYRPKERLVRLRGGYTPINTVEWEADLDCTVNVAIGTSLPAKRIQVLQGIAAKQEALLQMFGPGPDNPIVSLAQYSNTLAKIAMLGLGTKDASEFFKPVDPNWQPPPTPPAPPPPEIQIAHEKTQRELAIKQAELTLQQQKQEFDQELAIRKMSMDFTLRRYQIDAQFKANYTQANLEADAAQEEAALEGAMSIAHQRHEQQMAEKQHALAAQGQAHEQALAEDAQAHDQQMAQQQTDAQNAAPTDAPASEGE